MSTHKHIDKICAAAAILAVIFTLLFMNGEAFGIRPASQSMGYENRLFDASRVHTIDIVMDGWDDFMKDCENEEYSPCAVVIDGEAYKNTGIRAKGNTSLRTVSTMDSDRYSFKLEFDHYDSAKSYYGLDKLCLNNIIQDSTYMKDYLAYQMMGEFEVASPLCSYAFITVNGEDWGLYLAVEGVEDAFLERNYNSAGNLYKPDSTGFGGGRGNGKDFDMENFMPQDGESRPGQGQDGWQNEAGKTPGEENWTDGSAPSRPGIPPDSQAPGLMDDGEVSEDTQWEAPLEDLNPMGKSAALENIPSRETGGQGADSAPAQEVPPSAAASRRRGGRGGFEDGPSGMGSSDVKLQYIDDDPDSYPNIFNNAKTDVSKADKARLIQSLKALSQGTNLENILDIEKVVRYFVVHNFVCNGDSYTGSIIHNYYLYEDDGRLSMIPWDYNLAFGTFQASDGTSMVNSPIDTPVSGGAADDRPMSDWIFSSEEYTGLYHQYFSEFLENTDFAGMIDSTAALVAPYVEKDPSKFYSYEDFEKGIAALKDFCLLRKESVLRQLDGSIPSDRAGQSADSPSLVDASHLALSDMGSMGGGRGMGRMGGADGGMQPPEFSDAREGQAPSDGERNQGFPMGGFHEDFPNMEGRNLQPGDFAGNAAPASYGKDTLSLFAVSVLLLLAGLGAAFRFKR